MPAGALFGFKENDTPSASGLRYFFHRIDARYFAELALPFIDLLHREGWPHLTRCANPYRAALADDRPLCYNHSVGSPVLMSHYILAPPAAGVSGGRHEA